MDQKIKIGILITSGILIFFLGYGLGNILQVKVCDQKVTTEAVNILSSKIITSVTAYGRITKIDGTNVTLNSLGEDLIILIPDSARVYSFLTADGKQASTQQIVKFEDLKIGNSINVSLKLLPSGKFEAASVIILPTVE